MKEKVRIARIFQFDAAHRLPGHNGKCAGIHGHTYSLEVVAEGPLKEAPGTSNDGMVVDYMDIKKIVERVILEHVDHQYLNDVFVFRPTVENLALRFLETLKQEGAKFDIDFVKVKLWESPTAYCEVGQF